MALVTANDGNSFETENTDVAYEYDIDGNLIAEIYTRLNEKQYQRTYTYDANGNLIGTSRMMVLS